MVPCRMERSRGCEEVDEEEEKDEEYKSGI
jgi:hypothetical protein